MHYISNIRQRLRFREAIGFVCSVIPIVTLTCCSTSDLNEENNRIDALQKSGKYSEAAEIEVKKCPEFPNWCMFAATDYLYAHDLKNTESLLAKVSELEYSDKTRTHRSHDWKWPRDQARRLDIALAIMNGSPGRAKILADRFITTSPVASLGRWKVNTSPLPRPYESGLYEIADYFWGLHDSCTDGSQICKDFTRFQPLLKQYQDGRSKITTSQPGCPYNGNAAETESCNGRNEEQMEAYAHGVVQASKDTGYSQFVPYLDEEEAEFALSAQVYREGAARESAAAPAEDNTATLLAAASALGSSIGSAIAVSHQPHGPTYRSLPHVQTVAPSSTLSAALNAYLPPVDPNSRTATVLSSETKAPSFSETNKTSVQNANHCISRVITSGLTPRQFHNSCRYPVDITWCSGSDCSRLGFDKMSTIDAGGYEPEMSERGDGLSFVACRTHQPYEMFATTSMLRRLEAACYKKE